MANFKRHRTMRQIYCILLVMACIGCKQQNQEQEITQVQEEIELQQEEINQVKEISLMKKLLNMQ